MLFKRSNNNVELERLQNDIKRVSEATERINKNVNIVKDVIVEMYKHQKSLVDKLKIYEKKYGSE